MKCPRCGRPVTIMAGYDYGTTVLACETWLTAEDECMWAVDLDPHPRIKTKLRSDLDKWIAELSREKYLDGELLRISK